MIRYLTLETVKVTTLVAVRYPPPALLRLAIPPPSLVLVGWWGNRFRWIFQVANLTDPSQYHPSTSKVPMRLALRVTMAALPRPVRPREQTIGPRWVG